MFFFVNEEKSECSWLLRSKLGQCMDVAEQRHVLVEGGQPRKPIGPGKEWVGTNLGNLG